jgi:hypothetical protein
VPKRKFKVLPLSEKVEVFNLMRKEKLYIKIAKIYSKINHEIVKKKLLVLLLQPELQKLWLQGMMMHAKLK